MMIGDKKISKKQLEKSGGRVPVGVVKFKEIPCRGSAYIAVSATPSWGVNLFMDIGDDLEVGFNYDGCKELVRQLTEPLDRSSRGSKNWTMVGVPMSVDWCDRCRSDDCKSSLLVQRCQDFFRLTVHFDPSVDYYDFDVMMDADAAKRLAGFIVEASCSEYRNPRKI
jgi:hypothetical protein